MAKVSKELVEKFCRLAATLHEGFVSATLTAVAGSWQDQVCVYSTYSRAPFRYDIQHLAVPGKSHVPGTLWDVIAANVKDERFR